MMFYLLEAATANATATPPASVPLWQTLAGAIGLSVIISGVIAGIIGAYYQPVILGYVRRWRLRQDLYRDLANLYESAKSHIKDEEYLSKSEYIDPSIVHKGSQQFPVNSSIQQSRKNHQISRRALKRKLAVLEDLITVLKNQTETTLYNKFQTNQDNLQLFYQLCDCLELRSVYANFLDSSINAPDLQPGAEVPTTPLLTEDEARRLYNAERRFDLLKLTCILLEDDEDEGVLDAKLLNRIRGWALRGEAIEASGLINKRHRWCARCDKLVMPRRPSASGSFVRYYGGKLLGYYSPLFRVKGLRTVAHYYVPLLHIGTVGAVLTRERCKCWTRLPPIDHTLDEVCTSLEKDAMLDTKALTKVGQLCELTDDEESLKTAIPILGRALGSNDNDIKLAALECVGKNDSKFRRSDDPSYTNVLATLSSMFADPKEAPNVRAKIVWIAGEVDKGRKIVDRTLLSVLNNVHQDIEVRKSAAEALGKIGNEGAVVPLAKIMKDNHVDKGLRLSALQALGAIGSSKAIPDLIYLLNDKAQASVCRATVARILGNVGDQTAVIPLSRAINDEKRDVQDSARAALALINPGVWAT